MPGGDNNHGEDGKSEGDAGEGSRLGVTKLYTLARMAPASRHQLLREPRLADMGDREFRALTSPLLLRTRKVTGNMRGHGLRMKVRAMYEALTAG